MAVKSKHCHSWFHSCLNQQLLLVISEVTSRGQILRQFKIINTFMQFKVNVKTVQRLFRNLSKVSLIKICKISLKIHHFNYHTKVVIALHVVFNDVFFNKIPKNRNMEGLKEMIKCSFFVYRELKNMNNSFKKAFNCTFVSLYIN